MRSRVSFLIDADSRKARDTVICEKPLSRATSSMVGIARACQREPFGSAAREAVLLPGLDMEEFGSAGG